MKPIEVFYHLYIPDSIHANNWVWYVDQQLSLIRNSKLSNIATINMAITMPKYWAAIDGVYFIKDTTEDTLVNISFENKVLEYINLRYPFVNILDVRDTGAPNVYEGQTLKLLYDRCHAADIDVLYFHSKGISNNGLASVANWREILNYYCITQWANSVKHLQQVDVVGLKETSELNILSGNFWWATSSYIKSLPDPITSEKYMTEANCWPGQRSYRYSFERWVTVNDPEIHFIAETGVNHYRKYCFLEDVIKRQS
jgi:hypothetical protein